MSDAKEKKVVHVHIGKDHYKTVMTAEPHELIADEPESHGGEDLGPDPYDYLLMALGSCTVITCRMYADRKGWPVDEIMVELLHSKIHAEDCEDCEQKEGKIDHIEKELILKGDLTDEQRQRMLEISEKCPVNRTLKSELKMSNKLGQIR